MQTRKLHEKFSRYWKEYNNSDLSKVCNSIAKQLNLKGDCINACKNNWSKVCDFLYKWEGK